MARFRLSNLVLSLATAIALLAAFSSPVFAQGPVPDTPSASVQPDPNPVVIQSSPENPHRFWDTENKLLFAGVVVANSADFAVTYTNLQHGGQELNPVVRVFGRSFGGLAANFSGESAGTVAISYLFHKTGHHKMERYVSMVDIGTSTGAVAYGLKHR
jgi:hypothetical protein